MRSRSWSLLFVILAAMCWSTSGLWIRKIAQSYNSPAGLAFWRDLTTFVTLAVTLALTRPALLRVRRQDLPWLAGMGVISIGLFHVMWNLTVVINGIAIATVLQYNSVIVVPAVAWLLWREPLTRRKLAAALLALLGTILLALLSTGGNVPLTSAGLLIGVASAVAYSCLSIFGKRVAGSYSPWTVLTYAFGFATLTLLIWQLVTGGPEPLPRTVLPPFIILVLLTTIAGFGLYTMALQHLQAGVAAIVATSEVFFAAVVAYVLLGERLGAWQVIGSGMIVAGVVLVALARNGEAQTDHGQASRWSWLGARWRQRARDVG